MAPNPLDDIDEKLKATIHHLYALQSSTHGYLGPATQTALVDTTNRLVASLQSLSASASAVDVGLPFELMSEYVDAGRNPHIYTREFVERVQAGNAELKAKSAAIGSFRDALAEEIVREWPEMKGEVQRAAKGGEVARESVGTNGSAAERRQA